MAEREGFEPPIRLPVCRISSAVHSTTLPPLRRAASTLSPSGMSLVRRMQRRRQITRAEGGDQAGRRDYWRETFTIWLGGIRARATIAAVGRVCSSLEPEYAE